MCKMPFMEKLYKKDIYKVPSLEIKANLGCQREKKHWVPVSLGRFLSLLSRFLRAALPRQVVAAGRLSCGC